MPVEIFLCLGGVFLLTLIVITIVTLRYLSYRETLALAEKGLLPPERASDGKSTLRWGIIVSAIGLALCLGLYPVGLNFNTSYPLGFGPWMLLGLVPLFFGLSLILIYVLVQEKD
jgi:hypothetical protein